MITLSKTIHISDTVHGSIPISSIEKRIISTRIFSRLHNISQNSTAYLTFPTNRTRRFEHSIGTMHLAGQTVVFGINNADKTTLNDFFKHFEYEIQDILEAKLANDGDEFYRRKIDDENLTRKVLFAYKDIEISDYLYMLNTPKSVYDIKNDIDYSVLHAILYQAIRLVGLLHDVGHPPMSHITEFALKGIANQVKGKEDTQYNIKEKHFLECIGKYLESDHDLHEEIGNQLTHKLLEHVISNVSDPDDKEQQQLTLFELLVSDVTICILKNKNDFYKALHRIVDGSLDSDRLDYITRDMINSGIEVGKIEYQRLLSTIRLVKVKEGVFSFAPHLKNKDHVDDFFNRRWNLYQKIVYHHRVVKTDYLLENCIEILAKEYLDNKICCSDNDNNDFKNVDDEECPVIPSNISGIWEAISRNASRNAFFDRVLQWDDDWLLTVLRKHFYSDYRSSKGTSTYHKLEELISNRKRYYSLLKKDNDLLILDESFVSAINSEMEKLNNLIKELKDKKKEKLNLEDNNTDNCNEELLNVDPTIIECEQYLKIVESMEKENMRSGVYALTLFRFRIALLLGSENEYNEIARISIEESLKSNSDILDFFHVIKKVKTGTEKNLQMYSEDLNGRIKLHSYQSISSVPLELEKKSYSLAPFYIYLSKKNDMNNIDFSELIRNIGTNFGKRVSKLILNELEKFRVESE